MHFPWRDSRKVFPLQWLFLPVPSRPLLVMIFLFFLPRFLLFPRYLIAWHG